MTQASKTKIRTWFKRHLPYLPKGYFHDKFVWSVDDWSAHALVNNFREWCELDVKVSVYSGDVQALVNDAILSTLEERPTTDLLVTKATLPCTAGLQSAQLHLSGIVPYKDFQEFSELTSCCS